MYLERLLLAEVGFLLFWYGWSRLDSLQGEFWMGQRWFSRLEVELVTLRETLWELGYVECDGLREERGDSTKLCTNDGLKSLSKDSGEEVDVQRTVK